MERIRQSINGQIGPYERFNNYAQSNNGQQSAQRQRPLGESAVKPRINYHYLKDALKNSGLASLNQNGGAPNGGQFSEDNEMSRMQYINRNFTNANITNRLMNDQPPMA